MPMPMPMPMPMRIGNATVAALLSCASPVAAAVPLHWVPLAEAGARAAGVWRGEGYGHLLVLGRGAPVLYHVAGSYCYRDMAGTVATDDSFRLSVRLARDRIMLAAAPDQTHHVFDRIAALPAACTRPRAWSRTDIARVVAATFADLYPGFGVRGRDRATLAAALVARTAPADDAALYAQLTQALDRLDDAHVGLAARFGGEDHDDEGGEAATIVAARGDPALGADPAAREAAWNRRYRDGILSLLDGGGHHVASRRIIWGRIGTVGYLNIVTMGAFAKDAAPDDRVALDAALDEAMRAFRDLPNVIVDVTANRGGYDSVSLAIAGRFADRRRRAFGKRAVGAAGPLQSFDVVPSARVRYSGPVTLLTSDVTVSAGETFVWAMRALPHVRQIGGRTRGALSDQLVKPLPNGWTLSLPAEVYRDPQGRSAEGIGIVPDGMRPPFRPDHRTFLASVVAALQSGTPVSAVPVADR